MKVAPWHYIDTPLADSKIDMAWECPDGGCVIAKKEQFLAVLRDPKANREAKPEPLRFVVHFVGDMHQSCSNSNRLGPTRQLGDPQALQGFLPSDQQVAR
jgi:hypothetical protein